MPSSTGTSSSRRRFAVSPAARYRELHVDRTIYLLGTLLLLAPWGLLLLNLWSEMHIAHWVLAANHTTLRAMMNSNLQGFTQALGFGSFDLFVAAIMGLALFAYDRFAGGLFYSLEGPLRRREVFLAKAIFGAASILLEVVLGTAGTLLMAGLSGNQSLAGAILLRGLFDASGQLSLFATALAMGAAMDSVLSGIATAIWAGLPALGQSLLGQLFMVQGKQPMTLPGGQSVTVTTFKFIAPWIGSLAQSLPGLSPFQQGFYGWPIGDVLAMIGWFIAWTVLLFWLGLGWWQRAPFERLHDAVFFPFLWNLYYAFLALLSGLVITQVVTRGMVRGLSWAAIYAALSVAGWFFWRFVVRRRGQSAGSRHRRAGA